uniref:Uncharacterized protein n=1 Tax=Anguilla anguilla TaxID=7936 RepID=A0A0E9WPQ5_ANGAN
MRPLVREVFLQISIWLPDMSLLVQFSQWITITDNEMDLVAAPTFVRTKHDGVGSGIVEVALKQCTGRDSEGHMLSSI